MQLKFDLATWLWLYHVRNSDGHFKFVLEMFLLYRKTSINRLVAIGSFFCFFGLVRELLFSQCKLLFFCKLVDIVECNGVRIWFNLCLQKY